jgi:hypothetical protein
MFDKIAKQLEVLLVQGHNVVHLESHTANIPNVLQHDSFIEALYLYELPNLLKIITQQLSK